MKVMLSREDADRCELPALSLAFLERMDVPSFNREWSVIFGRIMPFLRNGKGVERNRVEVWARENPDFDCGIERLCEVVEWLCRYCDFLHASLIYRQIFGTAERADRIYAYLWNMR